MIPFFMDFSYLEPKTEVRLQEFRFNWYPQEPQLQHQQAISFFISNNTPTTLYQLHAL